MPPRGWRVPRWGPTGRAWLRGDLRPLIVSDAAGAGTSRRLDGPGIELGLEDEPGGLPVDRPTSPLSSRRRRRTAGPAAWRSPEVGLRVLRGVALVAEGVRQPEWLEHQARPGACGDGLRTFRAVRVAWQADDQRLDVLLGDDRAQAPQIRGFTRPRQRGQPTRRPGSRLSRRQADPSVAKVDAQQPHGPLGVGGTTVSVARSLSGMLAT